MAAITPNAIAEVDRGGSPSTGHWVQSGLWDAFWMYSAYWGCALVLVLDTMLGLHWAAIALVLLSPTLGLLHSWSTTYMVLRSPRMAEARAADPVRYVWIPVTILAVALAVGITTGATLRFPTGETFGFEVWPWILYLTLFWVGHFWHFGKQDFGVLSLYRSRAGQTDLRARQLDQAFTYAMMFAIQPVMYLSVLLRSPLGEAFYNVVPISPLSVRAVAGGAYGLAVAMTLVMLWMEVERPNRSIPKMLYYVVMLSHPIILFHVHLGLATYYLVAYLWSHWIIAIGLVARINSGYYRSLGLGRAAATSRHFLTVGAIAAVVVAVSWNYSQFRLFSGGSYRTTLATISPEQGLVVGVFLGLFLAEQLVHYYCDRCLFRMRDPAIRKAIGSFL